MKPASAKNKGRILQKLVRDKLYQTFPALEEGDILSTSMGASGEDLKLSPAARRKIPFTIECKNQEAVNVWKSFEQATTNTLKGTSPLLVIKRNRTEPLAVMKLDTLLALLIAADKEI